MLFFLLIEIAFCSYLNENMFLVFMYVRKCSFDFEIFGFIGILVL